MKIVGIIPSRYCSTRFPGKALAPLQGKPMLFHVCEAAEKSGVLDGVWVATDSGPIKDACRSTGYSVIRTKTSHKTPTSRVQEAAGQIEADLYVMIGGDEPLLLPSDIRLLAETAASACSGAEAAPFVVNAMTAVDSIGEALDCGNIKVVCDNRGRGLYTSRAPIPYPKGALNPPYRKFVSIGVYTREALDFFVRTEPGPLELAEECDLLRFLENNKSILFVDIGHHTMSVDTPKDLAEIRPLLEEGCGDC